MIFGFKFWGMDFSLLSVFLGWGNLPFSFQVRWWSWILCRNRIGFRRRLRMRRIRGKEITMRVFPDLGFKMTLSFVVIRGTEPGPSVAAWWWAEVGFLGVVGWWSETWSFIIKAWWTEIRSLPVVIWRTEISSSVAVAFGTEPILSVMFFVWPESLSLWLRIFIKVRVVRILRAPKLLSLWEIFLVSKISLLLLIFHLFRLFVDISLLFQLLSNRFTLHRWGFTCGGDFFYMSFFCAIGTWYVKVGRLIQQFGHLSTFSLPGCSLRQTNRFVCIVYRC